MNTTRLLNAAESYGEGCIALAMEGRFDLAETQGDRELDGCVVPNEVESVARLLASER